MRNMATLTAVASVLAIGMATANAAPLVPGDGVGSSEGLLQKVQRGGEQMGPGSQGPGARGDGAKTQQRGRADVEVERGKRGDGADRRSRVDIDVDRGRRGFKSERRTGVDIDVDRDRRRRAGRGGLDIYVGPGYGPGCGWLRRRAMDTGSGYWWRRYRACIGDL